MKKRFAMFAAVFAALFIIQAKANSAELGLTPSNVVSIWTNINGALLTSAEIARGEEGRDALEALTIGSFPGKKPADVLQQVAAFRTKLDSIGQKLGLKATTIYTDPDGGTVTPSVVFMNSGYVLDSIVLSVIKRDGERLVSGFYTSYAINGKKPSDAFAMVELASRRLELLQRLL